MRVLILTTQTPHHAFFVKQMAGLGDVRVVMETMGVEAPFAVRHPFEDDRDRYELDQWFSGNEQAIGEIADTVAVENVNCDVTVSTAQDWRPDLSVAFGTRRIDASVIDALGANPVNLHGGDPEVYRGLDSHMWAIYHGDFGALATTLHVLKPRLDDGPVVGTLPIGLTPGMPIHAVRKSNTETCVRLMRLAIDYLNDGGSLIVRPQRRKGRYYSFMPADLKSICVRKFASFAGML